MKKCHFRKSLLTGKFSTGKFFGPSSYGILTLLGFRKSLWKGVQQIFDSVLVARSRLRATKCDLLAKIWGVAKNRFGHNFQNIGSTLNQLLLIGYEPTLIRCISVFCNTAIWSIFFWKRGSTSATRYSAFNTPTPLCYTYSEPSGHEDSSATI